MIFQEKLNQTQVPSEISKMRPKERYLAKMAKKLSEKEENNSISESSINAFFSKLETN